MKREAAVVLLVVHGLDYVHTLWQYNHDILERNNSIVNYAI